MLQLCRTPRGGRGRDGGLGTKPEGPRSKHRCACDDCPNSPLQNHRQQPEARAVARARKHRELPMPTALRAGDACDESPARSESMHKLSRPPHRRVGAGIDRTRSRLPSRENFHPTCVRPSSLRHHHLHELLVIDLQKRKLSEAALKKE